MIVLAIDDQDFERRGGGVKGAGGEEERSEEGFHGVKDGWSNATPGDRYVLNEGSRAFLSDRIPKSHWPACEIVS